MSIRTNRSEHDDRAQHLAPLHPLERRLDVADPDALADEVLQGQAPCW